MSQTPSLPLSKTRNLGGLVFLSGELPLAPDVTAYLVNPVGFAAFNRAYAEAFSEPRPVRTTVRADLMLPGALLELTVVAGRRQ